MRDTNDGYIGIIGNKLVSTPIQFKIDTLVMAECWFPEQILAKHVVNIIVISGYSDDEEPLPADPDDDIAIYESALLQRKYAFGPAKVVKTIKQIIQDTSSSVPIQGNNIMFCYFFLVPPLLVATILKFDTGSSQYDLYTFLTLTMPAPTKDPEVKKV
jgi:hypothetical protein